MQIHYKFTKVAMDLGKHPSSISNLSVAIINIFLTDVTTHDRKLKENTSICTNIFLTKIKQKHSCQL